jgi:hypothetical protein
MGEKVSTEEVHTLLCAINDSYDGEKEKTIDKGEFIEYIRNLSR